MEVSRYVNGQRIAGPLPPMQVDNTRILEILQQVQTNTGNSMRGLSAGTKS